MSSNQSSAPGETQYIPGSAKAIGGFLKVVHGYEGLAAAYATEQSPGEVFNFKDAEIIGSKAMMTLGLQELFLGAHMWLAAAHADNVNLKFEDVIDCVSNEVAVLMLGDSLTKVASLLNTKA